MLPAYAANVLGRGPEAIGFILSMAAIGAVSGGLIIASARQIRSKGTLMLTASFTYGTLLVIFGLVKWFVLIIPVAILIGASQTSVRASNNSLLLELTPERLRGRVMSVVFLDTGLESVVSIIAGVISDQLGVAMGLATMGCICIGICITVTGCFPELRK
jgi:hypothetical protein